MIEQLYTDQVASVAELCDALEVSRSGFYAHLQKPHSLRRQEDQRLSAEIADAFQSSRGTYGSPRLTVDLNRRGHHISRHRTARLMRKLGIAPRQKRTFIPKTTAVDPHARHSPNLLLEQPPTTRIDQVWVCDITYIPTAEGFLYLSAVMDLHGQRILGWETANHMREELVATCNSI